MKRKLIILNLVLAALVVAAGWRLRVEWLKAKQHEDAVLRHNIPAAPPPPYIPLLMPPPVTAVQYFDIAQKDLFSKERNPTVVIVVPPPPAPPPMPPMPVVRGILNIDGVTAIISENPKAPPKEVKPGEKVGEFTLQAINTQELVLEWNGQQVRKRVQDLMDHSIPEPPAPVAAAAPAGPAVTPTQLSVKAGPGVDMGQGRKACVPGDTTPVGTIVDGLQKKTWETPFGQGCAWEAPAK